jgi:PKD repeat protein
MAGNWTFVSDWSGSDVFQYSNYTLRMGNEVGSSGKGDCDDFSILLASLIESIGGTPRVIFAYSPTGGHAYTEVYLGKSNSKDLDRMMKWLRTKYNTTDVSIHADPENGDVWLNMDWWKDSSGATRPGGPFYQATHHILIYTLEDAKAPLTPIKNLPPRVFFSYVPLEPEIGQVVNFDASQSSSPNQNGKIVNYKWDFGDGGTDIRSVCPHIYSNSGTFRVNLTVTDNEGDKSSKAMDISVKEPHMSKTNYSIEVHTSSVGREYNLFDGPDTNALVEITLYGEHGGYLEPKKLNDNLDNFEKGSTNIFKIYNVKDIGNITKIEIKFNERPPELGSVFGPVLWSDDWHLDKIVITNYKTNVPKTFEINDWLTKDGSYSYFARVL